MPETCGIDGSLIWRNNSARTGRAHYPARQPRSTDRWVKAEACIAMESPRMSGEVDATAAIVRVEKKRAVYRETIIVHGPLRRSTFQERFTRDDPSEKLCQGQASYGRVEATKLHNDDDHIDLKRQTRRWNSGVANSVENASVVRGRLGTLASCYVALWFTLSGVRVE
ncbi:hypothetical protein BDV98DRAFT_584977 [Pterulicium gracile]|uniref:Uncharacterized protein n=1 Tax=Pterulicium gracile TaxID=1884261 RepID=A0A5C3QJ30_9AGAR|nr:hypothetical protein BDV98DRAFT_584977 [Pterula gracilis]